MAEGGGGTWADLGRGLEEEKTVLGGESLALLPRDGALVFEIGLVAAQNDHHVLRGVLACVLQPHQQMIKRFCSRVRAVWQPRTLTLGQSREDVGHWWGVYLGV